MGTKSSNIKQSEKFSLSLKKNLETLFKYVVKWVMPILKQGEMGIAVLYVKIFSGNESD